MSQNTRREVLFRAWDETQNRMVFDFETTPYFMSRVITMYNLDKCMQYTGLKDKKGVRIYENDIIKNEGVVKWHFNRWVIKGKTIKEFQKDMVFFQVIGNLYQNPELLNN